MHSTRAHASYVKELRGLLPEEAFQKNQGRLFHAGAHLLVIATCYFSFRLSSTFVTDLLLSFVVGHSLACLAFIAHELSHGSILKSGRFRYWLENILWGLNFIPATMWRRIHNHSHHHYGNTLNDPDRFFTQAELEGTNSRYRKLYVAVFFPHKNTTPLNPFVWFHFITYVIRHLMAVFYPDDNKPGIVTYKPAYKSSHLVSISVELVFIAFIQAGLYFAVGQDIVALVWASPVAILFTSSIVMMYVWTNHYLYGLDEEHDPIKSSASVIVPRIFDFLHGNFSYHTEHHIFPSMNSNYAPELSRILLESYPEQYNLIPIKMAWRDLFRKEPYTQSNLKKEAKIE